MNDQEIDFDKWIDALATALRLEIAVEYRAGIKANLKVAATMAAILDQAELDDDAEPAPVFSA